MGGAGGGGGPGHRGARGRARAPAHPRRVRRRGARRRARPSPSARTPRSTTGRWPGPADHEARLADDPGALPAPADCGPDVLALLADPTWVYRQYDHQLFLNTVEGPGGDTAVLRLAAPGLPPSERGLALTTDSNPTWCSIDPRAGTAATVAEAALNLACSGATPMAVVNCLNFGNPEHPEVMWQLSEAIDGMSEACLALGLPVIGGNVSLYNESYGSTSTRPRSSAASASSNGWPPVRPGMTLVDGGTLVLLDASVGPLAPPPEPAVAGRVALGRRAPSPPQRHPSRRSTWPATAAWSTSSPPWWPRAWPGVRVWWRAIHDVSGGGLGVALAELAVRSGVGVQVAGVADHHELFTEAPSRVVVCTTRSHELLSRAAEAGVGFRVLGTAGGDRIVVETWSISTWSRPPPPGGDRLPGLLDDLAPVTN